MNKYYIYIYLSLFTLFMHTQLLYSQSKDSNLQYCQPMKIPMVLSGSFAELRSNHFHSGLDLKTNGREGEVVYCISEGYVSRIKVSAWGYGRALYITHADGHTSVYAHLQRFSDSIQKMVLARQYKNRDFETEIYPEKGKYKVKRGELIGWSGNSGSSGGPHLHFEIRNTATEEPINPLNFGFKVADQVQPIIQKIRIYPMIEDQTLEPIEVSSFERESKGSEPLYTLQQSKFFIGVSGVDYADENASNLGYYQLKLFLDNKIFFEFTADKINFSNQRYINSYIDYRSYIETGIRYQRSYKESNNNAKNLNYFANDGTIVLKDTLEHQIKVIATDFNGNQREQLFRVRKAPKTMDFLPPFQSGNRYLWNHENKYKTSDIEVVIPSKSFYSNQYFYVNKRAKSLSAYSNSFEIYDARVPLHKSFDVKIRRNSDRLNPNHLSKLCILRIDSEGEVVYVGGKISEEFISAKSRDFGIFYIGIDTLAPTLQLLNYQSSQVYRLAHPLVFKVSDNLSGIEYFEVYSGDQWLLLEYDAETSTLQYLPDGRLAQGEQTLKVKVRDQRGNQIEKEFQIRVE